MQLQGISHIPSSDTGVECTVNNFGSYTKLGGHANFLKDREALQRYLDRSDPWPSQTA